MKTIFAWLCEIEDSEIREEALKNTPIKVQHMRLDDSYTVRTAQLKAKGLSAIYFAARAHQNFQDFTQNAKSNLTKIQVQLCKSQ